MSRSPSPEERAIHTYHLRAAPLRPPPTEDGTPIEVYLPTFKRIRWEMSVLRKAGKDPVTIRASVAERILAKERKKK